MRFVLLALTLPLLIASTARAQCPDGSPPPCRGRVAASIDDRTWIVMPFANISGAQDIDWLREASVNLLYLNMSHWTDIRVVDDERVADAVRMLPAGDRPAPGLQAGIGIARRMRAGKLVMGDLIQSGGRTALVAKIYDVRSGRRERSVQEQVGSPDSVVPAYARLARAILGTGTPAREAVGTASLDAYRDYAEGNRLLNRWELDSAASRFQRAIRKDSTFALAYYMLARTISWNLTDSLSSARWVRAAEQAARYGSSLPQRERDLIAGAVDQSHGRYFEACARYESLLRADSADVEAWYNFGECNYHDNILVGPPEMPRFRSSYNTALRAFLTALRLDPTYHVAYAHIGDILRFRTRSGCLPATSCDEPLWTFVLRDADTLVTASPLFSNSTWHGPYPPGLEQSSTANAMQLRGVATRWVESAPTERRARLELASALAAEPPDWPRSVAEYETARRLGSGLGRWDLVTLSQGLMAVRRYAEASASYALVDSLFESRESHWAARRVEALLKADSSVRAALVVDSMLRRDAAMEIDTTYRNIVAVMFARCSLLLLDSTTVSRSASRVCSGAELTAAPMHDSLAGGASPADGFQSLSRAEARLVAGDSAAALEELAEWERRWTEEQLMGSYAVSLRFTTTFLGTIWLRTGDLAHARGARDLARRSYGRLVAMWSGGDPFVQPAVARARAALAALPRSN